LCDDVDLDRDRALVERCQAGDSAAFGNLYARYYERLLRFCLRRLNDRHEAEDAAQEAFARAWKALPKFAGERRFYPWLTVIAGNICTDMLRRRSRSTPTDDLELSAHQPVGAGGNDTAEELVLAGVDGELVNRALGRLSVRHRHVLGMREGSGWTYQQIADHEGVEIGTIETLLWRARQALKREFNVLSESKGVLAGFLAGAGALVRRGMFRVAHKSAVVQQSGGTGGLRNAVAGVAVTSAAVAAALITPHALSTPHNTSHATFASAVSNLGNPTLPLAPATKSLSRGGGASGGASGTSGGAAASRAGALAGGAGATHNSSAPATSTQSTLPLGAELPGTPAVGGVASGAGAVAPVVSGLGSGVQQVTSGATGALNSVTHTVSGLANTLGLQQVLGQLPPVVAPTTTTTSTTVPGGVAGTLKGLLGGT
jgi:RNA polymerase sigma-70 factor (ECF subfamily)